MIDYKESASINGQFIRNDSKTGYGDKTETVVLSGDAPYIVELEEKISAGSIPTAVIGGVPVEFLPFTFTPGASELGMDRRHGFLRYNPADVGKTLSITYTPAGSVITAAKLEVMFPPTPTVTSVNGMQGDVVLEIDDIDGLQEALDSATPSEHTHPISDITGLQDALNGKAAAAHTHDGRYFTKSQIGEEYSTIDNVNDTFNTLQGSFDAHTENHANPHEVTKAQVGLGSVDNTSDEDKPVSTAAAAALAGKAPTVHTHDDRYYTKTYINGNYMTVYDVVDALSDKVSTDTFDSHIESANNPHNVTKAQVGLSNVNNTTDAAKPISTATATALAGKASTSHTHNASDINAGVLEDARIPSTIPRQSVIEANTNMTLAPHVSGVWVAVGNTNFTITLPDSPPVGHRIDFMTADNQGGGSTGICTIDAGAGGTIQNALAWPQTRVVPTGYKKTGCWVQYIGGATWHYVENYPIP